MSLERLAAHGEIVAKKAEQSVRDRLIARANLPPGVEIAPSPQGIVLSGKRLRHRYITDPELRNFTR